MVQALFFDLDDTLYDQFLPFKQAFIRQFDLPHLPIEALYKLSRQLSDELFEASENGQMTKEEMHIYRLKASLEYFDQKISDSQALAFQREYEREQGVIQLSPKTIELLDWCQGLDCSLGLITNGPAEHQAAKIKQLGLSTWFSDQLTLISGQVGFAKPHRQIFKLAQSKIGCEAREICYVGDAYVNDIVGAKSVDWQAIWFNRRHRSLPAGGIVPDVEVETEEALLEALQTLFSHRS